MASLGICCIYIFCSWYFLPIVQGYLASSIFKYIFFAFYALGMFLIAADIGLKRKKINLRICVPVFFYMAVLLFYYIIGNEEAAKHIRVSFMFWGMILLYALLRDYPTLKNNLTKFLMILFAVTVVTSLIALWIDPRVSRSLTYAKTNEDEMLQYEKLNVGSIYLIQSFVCLVPFLIFYIKNTSNKRKRIGLLVFLIIGCLLVWSASYFISLFLLLAGFFLSILFVKKMTAKKYIIVALISVVLILGLLNITTILDWLASRITNEYFSVRLNEISYYLSSGTIIGSKHLGSRFQLYTVSLETFSKNIFGIGPQYSYISYLNGIGYHSNIFDDLARYGIFSIVFYIFFFIQYYKELKKNYEKNVPKGILITSVCLYIACLILNIGFRNGIESCMMLFVVFNLDPVLGKKETMV